jgi:hypothetical protein
MAGKVEKVMHEFKTGTLRSSSGRRVTDREQAIAIGLSEARAAGERVAPPPGKRSAIIRHLRRRR